MRKLSLVLAMLLALCGCAFAETAQVAAEIAPVTAEALEGAWNLEYLTSAGYAINAASYGMVVTLSFNADGSAEMDYSGEVDGGMAWYIEGDKAFISGYNANADVELKIDQYGVLEITDSIGSMFFTRIEEK